MVELSHAIVPVTSSWIQLNKILVIFEIRCELSGSLRQWMKNCWDLNRMLCKDHGHLSRKRRRRRPDGANSLSLSLSLSLSPSLSPSFLTSPPPSLSLSLFHLLKAQPKRFSQGISPLYIEHCYRFGTTLRSVSALATGCIHLLGPDSDGWHL